jgi:hypothetical protein
VLDPAIGRAPVSASPPVDVAARTLEPLEGTNMSLFHSIIPNWWSENGLSSASQWLPADGRSRERCGSRTGAADERAADRVDAAEVPRGRRAAWVSSPDPNWFPNGIGDALFAIVEQMYGWGFAQYVTDFYADGFPRTWTVLNVVAT